MEDHFHRLPDCTLLDIFDRVSDVKALIRCRSVSKRFCFLVPYASSLHIRVDCVLPISTECSLSILSFIKALGTFLNLFLPLSPIQPSYSSPGLILRSFHCIQHLDIQLPTSFSLHQCDDGADLSHAFVRYRATFGETLKKCVILLGFGRNGDGENRQMQKEMDEEEDVKERVIWVIRVLVDACKRHDYAARKLVREHPSLASLRMSDREAEGVVEIDERGLEECRKGLMSGEGCRVPRVGMQMWYQRKMEVDRDRGMFEGSTLVLVRAVENEGADEEDGDGAAMEAFGIGKYKEGSDGVDEGQELHAGDEFISDLKVSGESVPAEAMPQGRETPKSRLTKFDLTDLLVRFPSSSHLPLMPGRGFYSPNHRGGGYPGRSGSITGLSRAIPLVWNSGSI